MGGTFSKLIKNNDKTMWFTSNPQEVMLTMMRSTQVLVEVCSDFIPRNQK
jgi:hypothetical protein